MFALHSADIGDLSKISIKEVDPPKTMSPQEVFVSATTFGFNYDDVAFAQGKYPFNYLDKFKSAGNTLGMEMVGVVKKVGSKVTHLKTGDRVLASLGVMGSFVSKKLFHHSFLRKIPDYVTDMQAAAYGRKGLWIHTLLYRVILIKKKQVVLIHNVADPMEAILCQWANGIGLKTIGTVANEMEIATAKDVGCDLVIDRSKKDVVEEVRKFTENKGVNVVYDSVGKDVEEMSVDSLQPFGTYIQYFAKNGTPVIDHVKLQKKSLFLTYPVLEQYKGNIQEMTVGLDSTFNAIKKGIISAKFDKITMKNADKAFKAVATDNFKKNIVIVPE